jgi:hypothetical protein
MRVLDVGCNTWRGEWGCDRPTYQWRQVDRSGPVAENGTRETPGGIGGWPADAVTQPRLQVLGSRRVAEAVGMSEHRARPRS